MQRQVVRFVFCWVIVLVVGLFISTTASAMLLKLDLRSLTKQSLAIVLGRVMDVRAEEKGASGAIYTYATIAVDRYLKGETSASKILVEVPGGVVGDLGLWVSDMPRFAEGEEVLLFLEDA